ncbi:MAG: ketoacyl-ACP synthase III [Burkholderiales bacterium]|nr:ketoacyl-ACP synthase III [Burkholderiales bacterium]
MTPGASAQAPIHARISGTGSYLPRHCVSNDELARRVDTSDEWISTRTGIRQRHFAAEGELASDMALQAALQAIEAAGLQPSDIGLIIVATTTPDVVFPSTACILQQKLGIAGCAAYDLQAVCSGFVYALSSADLAVRAGQCRHALVVGAEVYSRILDWSDRATCVLFGDGAGAVVLSASEQPGILSSHLHADGSFNGILGVPGRIEQGRIEGSPFVRMDGNAVFRFAVKVLAEVAHEALDAHGLATSDIDWLVPHQANIRIIEATARKLGLSMERVVVTVDRHANTSAASIPLALDAAVRDGRIRPGHLVMLEGVGGGFTWGSVLVRW